MIYGRLAIAIVRRARIGPACKYVTCLSLLLVRISSLATRLMNATAPESRKCKGKASAGEVGAVPSLMQAKQQAAPRKLPRFLRVVCPNAGGASPARTS